ALIGRAAYAKLDSTASKEGISPYRPIHIVDEAALFQFRDEALVEEVRRLVLLELRRVTERKHIFEALDAGKHLARHLQSFFIDGVRYFRVRHTVILREHPQSILTIIEVDGHALECRLEKPHREIAILWILDPAPFHSDAVAGDGLLPGRCIGENRITFRFGESHVAV